MVEARYCVSEVLAACYGVVGALRDDGVAAGAVRLENAVDR